MQGNDQPWLGGTVSVSFRTARVRTLSTHPETQCTESILLKIICWNNNFKKKSVVSELAPILSHGRTALLKSIVAAILSIPIVPILLFFQCSTVSNTLTVCGSRSKLCTKGTIVGSLHYPITYMCPRHLIHRGAFACPFSSSVIITHSLFHRQFGRSWTHPAALISPRP